MKTLKSSKKRKLNTLNKLRLCKGKQTLKKNKNICNELLRIILITPNSHIGSKSEKIKLIKTHFTKSQIIHILKSKRITILRPIKGCNNYEEFINNVILSIQTSRELPLF
tara:strand:- start:61 stop:390 length:330 start_codon:yes stop_codon:yes gene_type:complete